MKTSTMPLSRGYRSLLWPTALMFAGAVWLGWNLELLEPDNLMALFRFWPVAVIAVGLDLLLGSRSRGLSALVALVTAALALALLLAGPALGFAPPFTTYQFNAPAAQVESARVNLELNAGTNVIDGLESEGLIDIAMTDQRQPEFLVTPGAHTVVTLRHPNTSFSIGLIEALGYRATIRLSPTIPTDLNVTLGSGSIRADLRDHAITALTLTQGSGSSELVLPARPARYEARLTSGSGKLAVTVPAAARVNLHVSVGSGQLSLMLGAASQVQATLSQGSGQSTIELPSNVAVRIEGHVQSGSLSLPDGVVRVAGDPTDAESGTWETPGFSTAEQRIVVNAEVGSGALRFR